MWWTGLRRNHIVKLGSVTHLNRIDLDRASDDDGLQDRLGIAMQVIPHIELDTTAPALIGTNGGIGPGSGLLMRAAPYRLETKEPTVSSETSRIFAASRTGRGASTSRAVIVSPARPLKPIRPSPAGALKV